MKPILAIGIKFADAEHRKIVMSDLKGSDLNNDWHILIYESKVEGAQITAHDIKIESDPELNKLIINYLETK